MKPLALYCKSYSTDLRRVVRLAQSVREFNVEHLSFYVSVPQTELPLFREHLSGLNVDLMADEDILRASPRINAAQVTNMPGSVAQQVVKSEFWRMNISSACVCLDSDALFIRPFGQADFLAPGGTPYTMLDEAHDLLEDALRQKRLRVVDAFQREADLVQQLFGRVGRRYSFGPFPLVWHRDVWHSLDERYLQPKGMSFADAITQAPIESRWYGEALLAYQAVPLLPCQALFKVYHYAWQFDQDQRRGIGAEQLARLYCGVIYQSAWERDMDWPAEGGNWFSRSGRRLRRGLGRI
ncbi:DUF6492 family protein [Rhodoferax mekongensis]|uniref:DUF6492 family protein n=1 Tax=Rhodoferax mekongensis TaxID=3068341 RepID=A0ABZ0AWQ3_9BURK|nr:DUF6492 family protein [Rhodoferax sp. TBRC 17307]WNO03710.1 DUF6492 family protein [Rhodoferax sp. TBRC 17307]